MPRTELPFMAGPLVTLGYCCPLSLPVDVFGEDIAGKQLCLQGQEHKLAALPVIPTGNRKVRTRNDLSLKPCLRALFLPARPHLYNLQNNHSGDQCYKHVIMRGTFQIQTVAHTLMYFQKPLRLTIS